MTNDHYITKFLTDPWHFGQKRLHYFDFQTGRFDHKSSRKLYAIKGLNSPSLEKWLEKIIETPLSNARPRLLAADPSAMSNPKFRRAGILMLMLQGLRTGTAVEAPGSTFERTSKQILDGLASMSPSDLDGFLAALANAYSFHLIFSPPDHGGRWLPLSVPSAGIFPVSFADRGCLSGWATGVGLAIHPRAALLAAPPSDGSQLDLDMARRTIASRSIGNAWSIRVVLHPDLVASTSRQELRRELQRMRQDNNDAAGWIDQWRANCVRITERMGGLRVKEDLSGRLTIVPPAASQKKGP